MIGGHYTRGQMKSRWRLRLLLLAATVTISFGAVLPVAAATTQREPTPIVREYDPQERGESSGDTTTPIIWAVIGVATASLIGGTLYLLKREVGGFPADPDWVAPISVMRSSDSAEESEDYAAPENNH
jgi:hypothetical protein